MTGYTRADSVNNIADGNIINASDLDGEFDAVQAAFNNSTGHVHDGTAANGAPITKIGPTQDVVASATALTPKTTATVDVGSSSLKFKDFFFSGTGTLVGLTATGAITLNTTTNNQSYTTTGAGTITISSGTAGSINNMTIGGTTPLAGAFTTLTTSSTVTHNGGTANGVTYLNGSKVLTSGSALTFDGTNFATTGTATAAKLIPTGNSATGNGMYLPAANSVGISTNGTNAVYIDSTQNVGIGTSSPSTKLHVAGSSAIARIDRTADASANPELQLTAVARQFNVGVGGATFATAAIQGAYYLYDATAAAYRFVIDSSGNVGIGQSTNLTSKLTVKNSITFDRYGDATEGLTISTNSGNAVYNTIGGLNHVWQTAGTERVRFDTSGNVGIGTSSPSQKLHVVGNTLIPLNNSYYCYADTFGMGSGTGLEIFTATGDVIRFLTGGKAGTERMRIDSSGNLLVGTTSAVAKLTVEQTGANANGANIVNQTYNHPTLGLQNTATSGDNFLVAFTTDASSFRGSISYNRAGGLVAYNTTSDYRAKDISGPVTGSGALIDSVPVYIGKMKDATQERPMFIAHETPAYAHTGEKDAVDADGNPVYQQMDASALIPVVWAEIQNLRKRLTALEST